MLKIFQAITLLEDLKQKGYLDKSSVREINKDITKYLEENGECPE